MEPFRDDDWLDSLLEEEPAGIEDHGFTQRVIAALPHRPARARMRLLILFGFGLVASLVAFCLLPTAFFLWSSWGDLVQLNLSTLTVVIGSVSMAMMVWGTVVAATTDA